MSTTTQEGVFILLKVIKRHEEKRPEGRTELAKLKATKMSPAKHLFKDFMQLEVNIFRRNAVQLLLYGV